MFAVGAELRGNRQLVSVMEGLLCCATVMFGHRWPTDVVAL